MLMEDSLKHTQQLFIPLHPASLYIVGIKRICDEQVWTTNSIQQTTI